MSAYDDLYKAVLSNLAKKINNRVIVEDLEAELQADHHLLQAVIEDLHTKNYILGKTSNHRGPREYVAAQVRPTITKEHSRIQDPPQSSPRTITIQNIRGNNNTVIQGDGNQITGQSS